MKSIVIALTLLISMTTLADEVQVALSVTHIWGQTWEDENGEKHQYNEDNKFISYWNGNGFGAGAFVNSYGKPSIFLGRKLEKEIACGALRAIVNHCTFGLTFGAASGYQDADMTGGILPVFAPFWTVRVRNGSLGVSIYDAQAIITTMGLKF